MHGQKGLTLSGFIVWAILLIVAALVAFKIGPPYLEYLSVQANLKAVANDPDGRTGVHGVVSDLFNRRAVIDNINSIAGRDLVVTKVGDRVVITAEYTVCVPFVFNIRACMDFAASSAR